jgi:hypothetical protein
MKRKPRSYHEHERAGEHWKQALGSKCLREILPGDIERYAATRRRKVTPATVNRDLAFLKRVFNVAIADGKAEANPVRKVTFLRRTIDVCVTSTTQRRRRYGQRSGSPSGLKSKLRCTQGFEEETNSASNGPTSTYMPGYLTARSSKSGEDYHVPMNDDLRAVLRKLPSRLKSWWVFPSPTGKRSLDADNFMRRVFAPCPQARRSQRLSVARSAGARPDGA